ncbi:MAG: HAMP domain-containing histidine kinase [Deltaproteobacteria bacterium]|nr:HAMP domain-containing histidine kinase [Deltaproteobacteria bacterium]
MKPGKLYLKIFLSFLAVLAITEILIFAFFMVAVGKDVVYRMEHAQALLLKEVIEEKIRADPDRPLSENTALKQFIRRFDREIRANIWVAGTDGVPLVKSFEGGLPVRAEASFRRETRKLGNIEVHYIEKRHRDLYAIIPISVPSGNPLEIHIFFRMRRSEHPAVGFAVGLAVIGGVIALLIIPISRFITRPIGDLERSALRIAGGDLSHRAGDAIRKDEIGELARSFNHMAERLERMIQGGRELTANISHELRSPMARVRIAAELLRDKLERGETGDADRHIDEIRQDIEELDRLIGKILDLSKLDIHQKALKAEEIDMGEMIGAHLDKLASVIEQKGLSLFSDLPARQLVRGDRETLSMAFSNILDNAVKFVPPGGRVAVEIHPQAETLLISVTNTSENLPEKELSEIFEPFHRFRGEKAAGSGLGLAITGKVVGKHGGTIEAVNTDEGLSIRVRLPLTQAA